MKPKLIRITTVPISLKILLKDQLKFMNQYFNVIGVSSQDKEMSDVEKDEGIQTIELNMSREITPFKDLLSLIKMIFLLAREKPEIVHTHTPKAGIIGMVASWITRVPHRLHTVAGLPVMEATGKKKSILLAVERLTYACATKVYPNSYGLQDYVLQNKLTYKEKLQIIGHGSSNGIDTEYFQRTKDILDQAKHIKKEYQLTGKFVFCFVGRVVKDKGINELMYAFDRLSQKYKNTTLLVVGQLENKLDPISLISEKILENNDNIHYVGFQSDIRPYLAASDCFVLPTYREGFPNVVLQACSMELACIVTDINGCNEIIEDHKNGLIVSPKNKEKLYSAMYMMITEEELSTQLSLNNRNDIIKKYDRKVFHQYLLEEYNKVLKND
jgi:glycosyltransferase involved in cell wall biosynthesis